MGVCVSFFFFVIILMDYLRNSTREFMRDCCSIWFIFDDRFVRWKREFKMRGYKEGRVSRFES